MNTNKILAEAIVKDYLPKENSRIIALKKLDARAKLPAIVFTYTFGLLSALVAGLGMCFSLGVLGSGALGMFFGIVLGVAGFVGCGLNYPLYKKILQKGKEKYAYEIVELARQISEE